MTQLMCKPHRNKMSYGIYTRKVKTICTNAQSVKTEKTKLRRSSGKKVQKLGTVTSFKYLVAIFV